MKRMSKILVGLAIVAVGFLAFSIPQGGGIKAIVIPAGNVEEALAISGADTLKAMIGDSTVIFDHARAATYDVIIHAKDPFPDKTFQGVIVVDGQLTDLGTVDLNE